MSYKVTVKDTSSNTEFQKLYEKVESVAEFVETCLNTFRKNLSITIDLVE